MNAIEPVRRVVCARCGAAFGCDLSGECWCMAEDVKLPLPPIGSGEDCLCRACLRAAQAQEQPSP